MLPFWQLPSLFKLKERPQIVGYTRLRILKIMTMRLLCRTLKPMSRQDFDESVRQDTGEQPVRF